MLSHKSVDGDLKQSTILNSDKNSFWWIACMPMQVLVFLILINLMLFENINKVNKVLQFWNFADTNIVLKLS